MCLAEQCHDETKRPYRVAGLGDAKPIYVDNMAFAERLAQSLANDTGRGQMIEKRHEYHNAGVKIVLWVCAGYTIPEGKQ